MNARETAIARDLVARAELQRPNRSAERNKGDWSPEREEAGRRALAALREAERRFQAGGKTKPKRAYLHCVYCGVLVKNSDQPKTDDPPTCRLHRDLPAHDPHYGGYAA